MKKITLSFLAVFTAIILIAQAPKTFKYQAVARDNTGNILSEQDVSFQVSILEGDAGGTVVYTETHDTIANEFGLVNLEIGNGNPVLGLFETIDWGSESYFLQIRMDETGGTDYQLIGTSQLLSVPQANYADQTNRIKVKTTSEILDIQNPIEGMIVLNSDNNQIFIYNGTNWVKVLAGNECFPTDVIADAGENQVLTGNTTTTTLDANTPLYVNGEWSIVSGMGGIIDDVNNPNSGFSGALGTWYVLKWSINNICSSSYDEVLIYVSGGGEPCTEAPTVTDADGHVYPTIKIGDQCWMAENLDVGTHNDNSFGQTDNGIIEKHCFGNTTTQDGRCHTPDSHFGGLYQWDEMMNYTTVEGSQGICPDGWHIPTDSEWKYLEGYIDSQIEIGDTYWDEFGWRGYDVGINLLESFTNSVGYSAVLCGTNVYTIGDACCEDPFWSFQGGCTSWNLCYPEPSVTTLWTSSKFNIYPISRSLTSLDVNPPLETHEMIRRSRINVPDWDEYSYSVRCIKD